MSKKTFFLSIALITFWVFSFQNAFCQKNYCSGYVVTSKCDTIHGLISYSKWKMNPKKIFFKEDPNKQERCFMPLDLRGFSVANKIYESAIIETETSHTDINNISVDDMRLFFKKDTTFLLTIIKGDKSLYSYKDKMGKEQLYIKNGDNYDLLIFKQNIFWNSGTLSYLSLNNNKYWGQLALYLNDYPDIQKHLETVKYSSYSIKKLLLTYYKNSQSKLLYVLNKKQPITQRNN